MRQSGGLPLKVDGFLAYPWSEPNRRLLDCGVLTCVDQTWTERRIGS